MKNKVLIIAGLPGSGKTTASDFFKEKGIPVVRMGDLTDKYLKARGLSISSENEKMAREELRSLYGEDIYAKKTLEIVIKLLKDQRLIIIEGMKSKIELQCFRKKLENIFLVYIRSRKNLRYKRLLHRKARPMSRVAAMKRDNDEISKYGLSDLEKSADFIITNNGTKQEFYGKLNAIYHKFI